MGRALIRALLCAVVMLPSAPVAHAQKPLAHRLFETPPVYRLQQDSIPVGRMVVGGSVAAVVSFFGGAFVVSGLEHKLFPGFGGDDPGLFGALLGAALGPAIAVPISVHVINDKRGSLQASMPISLLIGGVAFIGTVTTGLPGLVVLLAAPFVEVATSVNAERKTSR
jgi:hypothetical protein